MSSSNLESVVLIRHRAAIAGYVTNAITGAGISGVNVTIEGTYRRTQTDAVGFYYFHDLNTDHNSKEKLYELKLYVPKESRCYYGGSDDEPLQRISVNVSNPDEKIILDPSANVKLSPTTLKGSVKNSDNDFNSPLSKATVKLLGSEIQTFADHDGKYTLTGFPLSFAGTPVTLTVQASDIDGVYIFATASVTVTKPGRAYSVPDIVVSRSPFLAGLVTIRNAGDSGKHEIESANVAVFQGGKLVASTEADENGSYTLYGLPTGFVVVKVSADGFQNESETVTLAANSNSKQDFILSKTLPSLEGS